MGIIEEWQKFTEKNKKKFEKYKLGFLWDFIAMLIMVFGGLLFLIIIWASMILALRLIGIAYAETLVTALILIITSIIILFMAIRWFKERNT